MLKPILATVRDTLRALVHMHTFQGSASEHSQCYHRCPALQLTTNPPNHSRYGALHQHSSCILRCIRRPLTLLFYHTTLDHKTESGSLSCCHTNTSSVDHNSAPSPPLATVLEAATICAHTVVLQPQHSNHWLLATGHKEHTATSVALGRCALKPAIPAAAASQDTLRLLEGHI
jgi:hypothetical protein